MVGAAVEGAGVTRVGRPGVEEELSCGALVTILDEYECSSVPVHLVYVKQGLMPLKVRAFLDWMAPRLRSSLKEGTPNSSLNAAGQVSLPVDGELGA